jgi:hypothetical protein
VKVVALAASYALNETDNAAWHDLFARLYQMQADLGKAILEGRWDDQGRDLTPHLRAAFGVLEDIIAIPAKIQGRKAWVEETLLKIPPHLRETLE